MAANEKNILSSSLISKEHLAVFDDIVRERFANIDLTPLLMYLIDVAPVAALPALAQQFDVLGFNGWFLTSNEADRRELIKRAIELKRSRGTPWAVREALKSVGYADVIIEEGVGGFKYNGIYNYDGEINYGAGNWANFSLKLIDLGETKGFSTSDLASIELMVDRYKNARSKLLEVLLTASNTDFIDITDEFTSLLALSFVDSLNTSFRYDGIFNYDGSKQYGVDTEEFRLFVNLLLDSDTFGTPDDSELSINIVTSIFKFIILETGERLTTEDNKEVITEFEIIPL
jgi:P2-related tail formation protein